MRDPKFSVEKLRHAISTDLPKRLGDKATHAAWDEVFRELLETLQELDARVRAVAQETQLALKDLQERLEKPRMG